MHQFIKHQFLIVLFCMLAFKSVQAQKFSDEIKIDIQSKSQKGANENVDIDIEYILTNVSDQVMYNIDLNIDQALTSGEQYTSDQTLVFVGDPNQNGKLDPSEKWIYTAKKSHDPTSGKSYILQAGVTAQTETSTVRNATASIVHSFDTNVEITIEQEYANPGDSLDVMFTTRLKVDEELAKEPGTTFITVGDTLFEVPLPKTRWEGRDIHLKILGYESDEYFPVTDMPSGLPISSFCEQDFQDGGRNTDGVLDECESIETFNEACDSTSTEVFCKFPDWVFCMRVAVPEDVENGYFTITAFDSMSVWKADEFPPNSDEFNEYEDVSMIIEQIEMDIDSVLIGSVNTDDETILPEKQFSVHPNPFNDQITITGKHLSQAIQVEILNLNGQVVANPQMNQQGTINLRQLPKGYYLCVIKSANANEILQIDSIVKH